MHCPIMNLLLLSVGVVVLGILHSVQGDDNNLYVFVAHYHPFCLREYGLGDFDEAERIAKENKLTEIFDLRFHKINTKDSHPNPMSFSAIHCYGPPTFEFIKYGVSSQYGYRPKRFGSNVPDDPSHPVQTLSDWEKSTAGMLKYLEGQTKSKVDVLRTGDEVANYVAREEFSILGYFKHKSKNRFNFYLAAEDDGFKGFKIAEVRNSGLTSAFSRDTVVVNQEFGRVQLQLDEDLTKHRISAFIKANANSSSSIKDLTVEQLEEAINKTSVVFVMFRHDRCGVPEIFDTVAEIAKQNGMLTYLDLKFASIDIGSHGINGRYGISRENCNAMDWNAGAMLRLFRYGNMIKYGASRSGGGVMLGQNDLKLEGMLDWLDKVTKPAAVPILDPREFVLKVEYNEVSVMGYFMEGSRARFEFYRAADDLKDYVIGDVASAEMNPYSEDIVVLFNNFGESRVNLTGANNLTHAKITAFVRSEAKTESFPIPTRPTPTPPTTTTDRPNKFYQETKQIAIFDLKGYEGNKILIDLSPGCVQIPQSWGLGTWSIQTYGQCVDFYENPGCSEARQEKQFRLDKYFSNGVSSTSNHDLSGVKPEGGFQSMKFCPKYSSGSDTMKVSVALLLLVLNGIRLTFGDL